MITKGQMQAFYEQQIAEKGKKQFLKEAMQWASQNKMVSLEKLKALPLREQQIELQKIVKMYSRSLMPELEEWQREIRGLIVAVNVGEKYPFDWADYHKRGIELAKKLRERLATEYDLWYEAPAEDMSGTLKERIF